MIFELILIFLFSVPNIFHIKPFVVTSGSMKSLYPVYAKFNILTKTNLSFDISTINKPSNPSYVINDHYDVTATITFIVDNNTKIKNDSNTKFEVVNFERLNKDNTEEIEVNNDGKIIKVPRTLDDSNIVMYLIIFTISLLGIIGLLVSNKKMNSK